MCCGGGSGPRFLRAAGGGLSLLEMFSRNTVQELRNRGYQTTALFGHDVTKEDVRRLLPKQDIFLWEGHHSTLIKDYCLPEWTEPLEPSLLFIQSCLALKDYKAQPLIERGALSVVGSSTRIYSASGGAFAPTRVSCSSSRRPRSLPWRGGVFFRRWSGSLSVTRSCSGCC